MEMTTEPSNRAIDDAMARVLHASISREASDVHLVPGFPVTYRIHGRLEALDKTELSPETVRTMVLSIVPETMRDRITQSKNFDCSVVLTQNDASCRFRANVFFAQGELCACLRHVPNEIPSFEWMGFPPELAEKLLAYTNGLVIIAGVTGSGKSTTLASLIRILNERGGYRVITVEEPIEYVHTRIGTTMVTQREVGRDVDSFYDGLKYGLRQDPDVILVGEIRDRETARMAISAAETGHLILSTLHTKDAKGAVTRLVDLFPHDAQDDIRSQLSMSLRSVVSQHLLPSTVPGEKRVLAMEVLHVTQQVSIAIKQGKITSIESLLQTGKRDGQLPLDADLQRLAVMQKISMETARRFAKNPNELGGV